MLEMKSNKMNLNLNLNLTHFFTDFETVPDLPLDLPGPMSHAEIQGHSVKIEACDTHASEHGVQGSTQGQSGV